MDGEHIEGFPHVESAPRADNLRTSGERPCPRPVLPGRSTPLAWTLTEALCYKAGGEKSKTQSLALTFHEEWPHVMECAVSPHLPRLLTLVSQTTSICPFSGFLQCIGVSSVQHGSVQLLFLQAQCCSKTWPKGPIQNYLGERLQVLAH